MVIAFFITLCASLLVGATALIIHDVRKCRREHKDCP